jgi:hypothetical protein
MHKLLLSCLLLASSGALAQQQVATPDAGEALLTMRIDGDVTVDPQGKVSGYHIDTEVQSELKVLLEKAIPTWSFVPVVLDGNPVAVKSGMRITLAGKSVEGGYRISIDNVSFHEPEREHARAQQPHAGQPDVRRLTPQVTLSVKERKVSPRFPRYAANGIVVVYVRAGLDGSVEDAIATQSALINAEGEPALLAQARKEMEDNAVAAIREWKLDVDAHGKTPDARDLTGAITVEYVWGAPAPNRPRSLFGPTVRGSRPTESVSGKWRNELRGPMRKIPWLPDARLAEQIGVSDAGDGIPMVPLASPLQLRDGAIGKTL